MKQSTRDERRLKERKQKIVKYGLELYDKYCERYLTIIPEYEELLEEKRELIKHGAKLRLDPICKNDLKEFTSIPLFKMDRDDAERLLNLMNISEASVMLTEINMLVNGYLWSSLENRILEYKYQIKRHYEKKRSLAPMPGGACSNNGKKPRRRTLSGG